MAKVQDRMIELYLQKMFGGKSATEKEIEALRLQKLRNEITPVV